MLLNGLLKYRHPDFNDQMLDVIERMTHGLTGHLALIPAKIAAIRTSRLHNLDDADLASTSSAAQVPRGNKPA
jgi:hypothetical protein